MIVRSLCAFAFVVCTAPGCSLFLVDAAAEPDAGFDDVVDAGDLDAGVEPDPDAGFALDAGPNPGFEFLPLPAEVREGTPVAVLRLLDAIDVDVDLEDGSRWYFNAGVVFVVPGPGEVPRAFTVNVITAAAAVSLALDVTAHARDCGALRNGLGPEIFQEGVAKLSPSDDVTLAALCLNHEDPRRAGFAAAARVDPGDGDAFFVGGAGWSAEVGGVDDFRAGPSALFPAYDSIATRSVALYDVETGRAAAFVRTVANAVPVRDLIRGGETLMSGVYNTVVGDLSDSVDDCGAGEVGINPRGGVSRAGVHVGAVCGDTLVGIGLRDGAPAGLLTADIAVGQALVLGVRSDDHRHLPVAASCAEHRRHFDLDGLYRIAPAGVATPFDVQCDMSTDGGGWTLVGRTGTPLLIRIGPQMGWARTSGDLHNLGIAYSRRALNLTFTEALMAKRGPANAAQEQALKLQVSSSTLAGLQGTVAVEASVVLDVLGACADAPQSIVLGQVGSAQGFHAALTPEGVAGAGLGLQGFIASNYCGFNNQLGVMFVR